MLRSKARKNCLKIAVLLAFHAGGARAELDWVTSANVDLNGDGVSEVVKLSSKEEKKQIRYKVLVGEKVVFNDLSIGDTAPTLAIVDLDKTDKFIEIVIDDWVSGMELHTFTFLRCEKNICKSLGAIEADSPESVQFNHKGIVLADMWNGFYKKRQKYVVKKGKITKWEAPMHFVGIDAAVRESFAIYKDESLQQPMAWLKLKTGVTVIALKNHTKRGGKGKKTKCEVLKYKRYNFNSCDLALVRSSSGLLGWMSYAQLNKALDLSWK